MATRCPSSGSVVTRIGLLVILVLPLSGLSIEGCVAGSVQPGDPEAGAASDASDDGQGSAEDAGLSDASENDRDAAAEDADDLEASGGDAGEQDAAEMSDAAGSDDPADAGNGNTNQDGSSTNLSDARVDLTPGLVLTFDNAQKTTSESGGQFAFRVALGSPPTAPVSLLVTVSNNDEAEVLTPSLTFTPADWSGGQQVLIEGKNDDPPTRDGDISYTVSLGLIQSADPDYDGLPPRRIEVVNLDDDNPAIAVTPDLVGLNDRLGTSEAGGAARCWLTLRTRPKAAVTIPIASTNVAEGVVNVSSVTIGPAQWNSVNWVTVTGVDDLPPVADGNVNYQIRFGPAVSADPDYNGLQPTPIEVANEDNDSAALFVTPQQTPLLTTEAGTTLQWVDVKLLTRPTAEVRVPVQSTDIGEALPDRFELVFDATNWSSAQRVSVAGVRDFVEDGLQLYEIRLGPTVSTDARYRGLLGHAPGNNYDIDSPDVLVTYDAALKTTELGGQASFGIVLTKAPRTIVTVPLQVLPSAAGTPLSRYEGALGALTQLVFTPTNYNSVHRVVVTGVDDPLIDGDQQYFVQVGPVVSADAAYAGRTLPNIALFNEDDDSAGVVVNMVGPVADNRLRLAEPGPSRADFTVRLATEPRAPVTVTFASTDLSEGTPPSPLVFVPSAPSGSEHLWSAAQTVSVQVVDDTIQDGPIDFHIRARASSADPAYDSAALDELVLVRTFDDGDLAGLVLSPTLLPVTGLSVTEPSGVSTFTVQLSTMPTSAVTIPIVSTDLTEGVVTVDASPVPAAGITIEPNSWNVPRTVALTSVRDDIDDGDQSYVVKIGPSSSLDRLYQNTPVRAIAAVTHDADAAGIVYDSVALPPGYSCITRENAPRDAAPLRLRLASKPAAPVTLAVSIQGPDADEATVSPDTLTFTESDWDQPAAHAVVVTGVDDAIDDGDREYSVVFAPAESADPNYVGKTPTPATLKGLNTDDADSFGVSVTGGPLELFEEGTRQELSIVLKSQPTAPVTIDLSMGGDAPSGATLSVGQAPASAVSLVFQPSAWSTPRVVVVTGVSDLKRSGHRNIAVQLVVTSDDANYDAVALPNVSGTVYDVPRSCKSALTLWSQTATGTGEYELDTDLDPSTPWHFAHCDMETDGGGWTLLAYSGDSATYGGVPYPGQGSVSVPYCLTGAGSAVACTRGSGLPREDLPGIFATATELAQGQTTTTSMLQNPYATRLIDYDFAGRYFYGAALQAVGLQYMAGTCTPLTQGRYFDIVGTAALDGTPVFLASALRSPLPSNYSSINSSYTWSVGTPGSACVLSNAPPASYLGTWQAAQSGPGSMNVSGSYSVWIR